MAAGIISRLEYDKVVQMLKSDRELLGIEGVNNSDHFTVRKPPIPGIVTVDYGHDFL